MASPFFSDALVSGETQSRYKGLPCISFNDGEIQKLCTKFSRTIVGSFTSGWPSMSSVRSSFEKIGFSSTPKINEDPHVEDAEQTSNAKEHEPIQRKEDRTGCVSKPLTRNSNLKREEGVLSYVKDPSTGQLQAMVTTKGFHGPCMILGRPSEPREDGMISRIALPIKYPPDYKWATETAHNGIVVWI
ncbi:unnamed protein product [Cuscuta campestris]|uniref:Uncharacterized protein n=1 Tax=Cuscuta campestris TaxID=132261 RepID=A0A484KFE7_9ASTE|nr:unnamed protein product [Cuscuta campestris]